MKPWLGHNSKAFKEKWQQVIDNATQAGLDLKSISIKRVEQGEKIPGLPMESVIAVYEYDGKEWDDLLLMVTVDKNIKLVEIPLSSYMFALYEGRRGKNIKDAKKARSGN